METGVSVTLSRPLLQPVHPITGQTTNHSGIDIVLDAGTPVLAYGRGGACESVLPGKTGYWFKEQTVESLADCIERFERDGVACSKEEIREHSRSFSEERFERELKEYCLRRMADWQQELLDCSHWEKEELD